MRVRDAAFRTGVAALVLAALSPAVMTGFVAVFDPLKVVSMTVIPDRVPAGGSFRTTAQGSKPWWSVRFCHAISSKTFIAHDGGIAEFEDPKNYNDGTVKRTRRGYAVPRNAVPGVATIWKTVAYKCGPVTRTIHGPRVRMEILRPE